MQWLGEDRAVAAVDNSRRCDELTVTPEDVLSFVVAEWLCSGGASRGSCSGSGTPCNAAWHERQVRLDGQSHLAGNQR